MNRGALVAGLLVFALAGFGTTLVPGRGRDKKRKQQKSPGSRRSRRSFFAPRCAGSVTTAIMKRWRDCGK